MRIISKQRDYYDGVAANAADDRPIYVRKQHDLLIPHGDYAGRSRFAALCDALDAMPEASGLDKSGGPSIIAFCGRMYPRYWIEQQWFAGVPGFLAAVEAGTSARDTLAARGPVKMLKAHRNYVKSMRKKKGTDWLGKLLFNETGWEAWESQHLKPVPVDLFLAAGAPTFHLRRGGRRWDRSAEEYVHCWYRVVVNPTLGELGFGAQVDAQTAYQELSMFLGNQMAQQSDGSEVVKTAEDDLRFDDTSFRQVPPGQKKERRKENKARKRGEQ